MLYKFLSAAVSLPIAALVATLLNEIASPLLDQITNSLGADAQVVVWGSAIVSWFVVFAFLSIVIDVLVGAVTESRVA